jgi:hypothetical protein
MLSLLLHGIENVQLTPKLEAARVGSRSRDR